MKTSKTSDTTAKETRTRVKSSLKFLSRKPAGSNGMISAAIGSKAA